MKAKYSKEEKMEQEKQQTEMSLIEQVAKNENITKEEVIAHMVEAIEIGWEKGMRLLRDI